MEQPLTAQVRHGTRKEPRRRSVLTFLISDRLLSGILWLASSRLHLPLLSLFNFSRLLRADRTIGTSILPLLHVSRFQLHRLGGRAYHAAIFVMRVLILHASRVFNAARDRFPTCAWTHKMPLPAIVDLTSHEDVTGC